MVAKTKKGKSPTPEENSQANTSGEPPEQLPIEGPRECEQEHIRDYPGCFEDCADQVRPCWLCDPEDKLAYLICIGEQFYKAPADFMDEAREQGISRKIGTIPKNLVLGETVIYLAHNKCLFLEAQAPAFGISAPESQIGGPSICSMESPDQAKTYSGSITVDAWDTEESIAEKIKEIKTKAFEFIESMPKQVKAFGIFSAFVPQVIEKLYWQSEIDSMAPEEKESLDRRGITPVGIPDGDKDHA